MAVQTLPARLHFPWNIASTIAQNTATLSINDDVDELAVALVIPATGTLTEIAIVAGTVTTTDAAVPLRIETIGTDGNPSGTLYDAAGTGTFNITGTDTIQLGTVNSGTGITVTLGDQVYVRWKRTGGGGTLSSAFRYAVASSQSISVLPQINDYNISAGTAWTKRQAWPQIALKIGGVWTAPNYCLGGLTVATGTDAYQTPAERGLLINFPVGLRITGAFASVFSGSSNTFKLKLYSDPLGTPVERAASATIDSDISTSAAGIRHHVGVFTTPYTTTANASYVIAVVPLTAATDITLGYWTGNATYAAAYPTGSSGVWHARADSASGAFSPTTTRIPTIGIIIDGIDAGASRPPFIIG